MNPDILLPLLIKKNWESRVRPVLATLGIKTATSLEEILGDLRSCRCWSIRIRRPAQKSIVIPEKTKRGFRCGDTTLSVPEPDRFVSTRTLLQITSVFGDQASAFIAPPELEKHVQWEEHLLLAIGNDFVTLIAEILPDADTFIATRIWPNVILPLYILDQRPIHPESSKLFGRFRFIMQDDVQIITDCGPCSSSGVLVCRKCAGTGALRPLGSCGKCAGAGRRQCLKCKGTGDFLAPSGRILDCRPCKGTGYIPCHSCDGTGVPRSRPCDKCHGARKTGCPSCKGTGSIEIIFDAQKGIYFHRRTGIIPDRASWRDSKSQTEYPLAQGAFAFLSALDVQLNRLRAHAREIQSLKEQIRPVRQCLELAMKNQEHASDPVRPLRIFSPRPTTYRLKGRVILSFEIRKPPKWARAGNTPYAPSAPVRLSPTTHSSDSTRQFLNEKTLTQMDVDARFHSLTADHNGCRILLSFPSDFDGSPMAQDLLVEPSLVPPAEKPQLRELSLWVSPNHAPRQLASLVHPPDPAERPRPPRVSTRNPAILANPRQRDALDFMMNGPPLVLVKGPPGTGKTTLIIEAVLQSIARGEKVLICSETHQAVSNVLERLHFYNNVRLVRHARADNPKLTPLEKEFLEDGSRHEFLSKVRIRSAEQILILESRRTRVSSLLSSLKEAQRASEELARARLKTAEFLEAIASTFRATKKLLTQNSDMEYGRIQADRLQALRPLLDRRAQMKARLLSLSQRRQQWTKECDTLRGYLAAGDFRETNPDSNSPTAWYQAFIPNVLASQSLLRKRFFMIERSLTRSGSLICRIETGVLRNESEERKIEAGFKECFNKTHAIFRARRDQAEEQSNRQRDQANEDLENFSRRPMRMMEAVAKEWNSVGIFPQTETDLPAVAWSAMLPSCGDALIKISTRLEFCQRWRDAAENADSIFASLFWDSTNVFLSTCVGLASWRSFISAFGSEGVDLVIIDEAAHATLTQALIPMGKARRVILIGDEMQLPPTPPRELHGQCEALCQARVNGGEQIDTGGPWKPEMSPCWLERSAFEWIVNTRPWVPQTMLNMQFRMHPDIAEFVSRVFYDGELLSGITPEERELSFGVFNKAVCLISTSAYKDRFEYKAQEQTTSLSNPLEARMTRRVLYEAARHRSAEVSFGVVSPYSAQCSEIKETLGPDWFNAYDSLLSPEDIASVDSFQGAERDVIIVSFVRSPKRQPRKCRICNGVGADAFVSCSACGGTGWLGPRLDWVRDLRRLNVAFSRAKRMLILIGDIQTLTDPRFGASAGADVLEQFRRHVLDRGKVLHVWEDPCDA